MEYKHIIFERRDRVARITLNRPPVNVLNIEMMREINHALESLTDDRAVKVLVFEAAENSTWPNTPPSG
jgi:enoyl-CoA hydratase/carnithine racemase